LNAASQSRRTLGCRGTACRETDPSAPAIRHEAGDRAERDEEDFHCLVLCEPGNNPAETAEETEGGQRHDGGDARPTPAAFAATATGSGSGSITKPAGGGLSNQSNTFVSIFFPNGPVLCA
jgi:hypothetical protein